MACGLRPIADNRPETRPVMMVVGVAVVLTATGADWVTTAVVLAWKVVVETAVAVTTAGVAVATDAAGAVALAAFTEAFVVMVVVAAVAGDAAAKDRPFGVIELALPASGVDFVVGAVVAGAGSVVVVLLVDLSLLDVALVGLVLVVAVPVTEVLAPPEVCTTPAGGSVEDAECVEEFVDDSVDDSDAAGDIEEGPDDEDPADVEPLDESVDEEPLGSATAIDGLLAIAAPSPSATANAPTRPT